MLVLNSCHKSSPNAGLLDRCFTTRYVGTGCLPVIQLLDKNEQNWATAVWKTRTQAHQHCVSALGLTDSLLDGRTFRFTVVPIDTVFISPANCWSPGLIAHIADFRDDYCQPQR